VDFSKWNGEYVSRPQLLQSLILTCSDVSQLLGNEDKYGSYQVFGNLSVAIDGITSTTKYNRSLDLDTGIHSTIYTTSNGSTYTTTVYCTYPDQVCVYDVTFSGDLPEIKISFDNQLTDPSLFNATCGDQHVRLTGVTQLGPPTGMKYDGIARLLGSPGASRCSNTTSGTLIVPASSGNRKLTLVVGAGTDYDQKAGNAASNYSFKGIDPGPYVEAVTSAASEKTEKDLRQAHVTDYQNLMGEFVLDLPDTAGSAGLETSFILDRYSANSTGDPYVESLLFQLGRHFFISSSRDNSLPPNLAGRWSETLSAAWSADYHANINIQMNHWGMDATGLGDLQSPLWNYMQDTWVPRGTDTAKLLYGAPGWVVHDEINIFGHTAMKDTAQWANYPASAAWMMQHVYDHFTYSQNVTWLETQGYPLIRGVAEFWLSQLQEDTFFNDGTLVVNPCNSPEHGPTVRSPSTATRKTQY
jgi:alpha-L-fucosidase 2